MILRSLPFAAFYLFLASAMAHAQDLDHSVLPITELRPAVQFHGPRMPRIGIDVEFGTGFCLDPECRLIGTNYHVAMLVRPSKIKGEKIIQRYLASGPTDKGATPNQVSTKLMAYAYGHDLAIFELRHPLPHYHGVRYSLEDLEPGLEVDIYGYPLESINPVRKLLQFHATFKAKTTSGLLAFDYSPAGGKTIRGGASGGVVVDRKA